MKKKTALVTGICGQDGSFLADLLLEKNYSVVGVMRRNATRDLGNAKHLEDKIDIVEGDITDMSSMLRIIQQTRPHEIYNMAAMSVHPETYINIRRTGASRYIKQLTIEELWNKSSLPVESAVAQTEGGHINIEVKNWDSNKYVSVLGYEMGMGQWFNIKQISRHWYSGKLIRLRQKFGEITVTPNHSVYNSNGFLDSPTNNPKLLPMRKVNFHESRPYKIVKLGCYNVVGDDIIKNGDWMCFSSQPEKKIRSSLSEDDGSLQAFLRFCGAFISEGWTTYDKKRKRYYSCICQNDKEWLVQLQNDLNMFYSGPSCFATHRKEGYKDVYRLEISSKFFYYMIRKHCGKKSNSKCIPDFFFLVDRKWWPELLNKLREGDGSFNRCKNYNNIRYGTTSKKLISQLCYIWTELGIDYNYSHTKYDDKKWNDKYEIRQVQQYQKNNGLSEYEEINYEGYVYDISVDEVQNFCAGFGNIVVHNSHVHTSFEQPLSTLDIDTKGVVNILESIKTLGYTSRLLHASTSEMFGSASPPQNMETVFQPQSPYAIAKVASHHFIRLYRESYGMYCCAAVTFNHEGTRRGPNFVTRKITMGVAQCLKDPNFKLHLGNLDAKRDWGNAEDYVEGFVMALQQENPRDYIFATGEMHSIREFCEVAFSHVGLNWEDHVEVDRFFMRPAEVDALQGDYSETEKLLGWKPKTTFEELVKMMVDHDCDILGV